MIHTIFLYSLHKVIDSTLPESNYSSFNPKLENMNTTSSSESEIYSYLYLYPSDIRSVSDIPRIFNPYSYLKNYNGYRYNKNIIILHLIRSVYIPTRNHTIAVDEFIKTRHQTFTQLRTSLLKAQDHMKKIC
jgi:hypothetical protein